MSQGRKYARPDAGPTAPCGFTLPVVYVDAMRTVAAMKNLTMAEILRRWIETDPDTGPLVAEAHNRRPEIAVRRDR